MEELSKLCPGSFWGMQLTGIDTPAAFDTMTVVGRKTCPVKILLCMYIAPFTVLIVQLQYLFTPGVVDRLACWALLVVCGVRIRRISLASLY